MDYSWLVKAEPNQTSLGAGSSKACTGILRATGQPMEQAGEMALEVCRIQPRTRYRTFASTSYLTIKMFSSREFLGPLTREFRHELPDPPGTCFFCSPYSRKELNVAFLQHREIGKFHNTSL